MNRSRMKSAIKRRKDTLLRKKRIRYNLDRYLPKNFRCNPDKSYECTVDSINWTTQLSGIVRLTELEKAEQAPQSR